MVVNIRERVCVREIHACLVVEKAEAKCTLENAQDRGQSINTRGVLYNVHEPGHLSTSRRRTSSLSLLWTKGNVWAVWYEEVNCAMVSQNETYCSSGILALRWRTYSYVGSCAKQQVPTAMHNTTKERAATVRTRIVAGAALL